MCHAASAERVEEAVRGKTQMKHRLLGILFIVTFAGIMLVPHPKEELEPTDEYEEPPLRPIDRYERRRTPTVACWLGETFLPPNMDSWALDLYGRRIDAPRMCRPPNTVVAHLCRNKRCDRRMVVETTADGTLIRNLDQQFWGGYQLLRMEISGDGYWLIDPGSRMAERYSLLDIEADPLRVDFYPNNNPRSYCTHGDALVIASWRRIRIEGPNTHGTWEYPEKRYVEFVGSDGTNLWILELEGRLSKLELRDGVAVPIASIDLGDDIGVGLAVDSKGVAVLTDRVIGPPTLLRLFDLDLNLLAEHPFDPTLYSPHVLMSPTQVAVGDKEKWEFYKRP